MKIIKLPDSLPDIPERISCPLPVGNDDCIDEEKNDRKTPSAEAANHRTLYVMTDHCFKNIRERNYEELCEATRLLEMGGITNMREMKIDMLRDLLDIYRMLLERNKVNNQITDGEYNLLSFFGSLDYDQNRKKLRHLKARLNKLWKAVLKVWEDEEDVETSGFGRSLPLNRDPAQNPEPGKDRS